MNPPTPSSNQVEPDEAAVRQHLKVLAAPAVSGSLNDGLLEIAYGTTGPDKAHLFTLNELHLAVDFALRTNRAGHQIYVGPALRRPGTPIGKRTTKKAFYGSYFGWLDDAADWAAARAAWSDCPPDLITCTGQIPEWRGQLLWRFLEPITDRDCLEELNAGIQHRLGGEDVHNADRLMRLAGTINWPLKPGRTVPELVTLSWVNGAGSVTDPKIAVRVYSQPQTSTGSTTPTGGPRTIFGQIDLDKAITEAAKPGRWHSTVRDTVAHLVGRKAPDDMIHAICRNFTQPGFTHEQTQADVDKMLEGARGKWGGETFDQVDQKSDSKPPIKVITGAEFLTRSYLPAESILGPWLRVKILAIAVRTKRRRQNLPGARCDRGVDQRRQVPGLGSSQAAQGPADRR